MLTYLLRSPTLQVTMSMLQICWPWSSRELQRRSLPARPWCRLAVLQFHLLRSGKQHSRPTQIRCMCSSFLGGSVGGFASASIVQISFVRCIRIWRPPRGGLAVPRGGSGCRTGVRPPPGRVCASFWLACKPFRCHPKAPQTE